MDVTTRSVAAAIAVLGIFLGAGQLLPGEQTKPEHPTATTLDTNAHTTRGKQEVLCSRLIILLRVYVLFNT